METGPGILLYGAVKLVAYTGWCWFALRLAGSSGQFGRALSMGLLRWVLGLVIGVLLFFMFSTTQDQVVMQYIAIYVPVRALEWGLLAAWVLPPGVHWRELRRLGWVVGGIVLSFLTDLTSPEMIEHGRFCVGRCLC